jgi:hypothetical protein
MQKLLLARYKLDSGRKSLIYKDLKLCFFSGQFS